MIKSLDFSGIIEFWKIHDIFTRDLEPTANEWYRLFNTPGYKALTASEFSVDQLKELITIALKPSRDIDLKNITNVYKKNMITHYRRVSSSREMLYSYEKELRKGGFLEESLRLCLEFLPLTELTDSPPISFLIFDNDARGYSPIVIDLLACKSFYSSFQYLIAHEAHHYYRNKLSAYQYNNVPLEYQKLIRVFNQIQLEGIADCIDKTYRIHNNKNSMLNFIKQVNEAPSYLTLINKTLTDLSTKTVSPKNAGELLNHNLPLSGHPIGYYMAQVIIAAGKKDEMIKSCTNCFNFFVLYNQCADQKSFNFNDIALNTLGEIEQNLFIN